MDIHFNNTVDLDAIKQVISTTPAIPVTVSSAYDGIELHGKFLPGIRYAVNFNKPPAGIAAGRVPRPTSLSVVVPDRSPGMWFESEYGYLGSEGHRTVLAHIVNSADLRATVTRVYDNNIVAWRNANRRSSYSGIDPYGRPLVVRDFHLPTRKNETQDLSLTLDDLLPDGEARDGIYQVTLRSITPNEPHPRWADNEDEDSDDYHGRYYDGRDHDGHPFRHRPECKARSRWSRRLGDVATNRQAVGGRAGSALFQQKPIARGGHNRSRRHGQYHPTSARPRRKAGGARGTTASIQYRR